MKLRKEVAAFWGLCGLIKFVEGRREGGREGGREGRDLGD